MSLISWIHVRLCSNQPTQRQKLKLHVYKSMQVSHGVKIQTRVGPASDQDEFYKVLPFQNPEGGPDPPPPPLIPRMQINTQFVVCILRTWLAVQSKRCFKYLEFRKWIHKFVCFSLLNSFEILE